MPAGGVLRGDFVFAIMLVMRCGRRILVDRVNATKPFFNTRPFGSEARQIFDDSACVGDRLLLAYSCSISISARHLRGIKIARALQSHVS
jgi:hypothetical protein